MNDTCKWNSLAIAFDQHTASIEITALSSMKPRDNEAVLDYNLIYKTLEGFFPVKP